MHRISLQMLFWLVTGLFGLGFAVSSLVPYVGTRLPQGRHEQIKTWATRGALLLAVLAGGIAASAGMWYLTTGAPPTSHRVWGGPFPESPLFQTNYPLALDIYVDALAALFVVFVGFFTVCVGIYSFGWLAEDPLRTTVAAGFNLFAYLTLVVLVVDNAFWMILVLESMGLSFGYLVLYRGRRGGNVAESRLAMRVYFIVSHLSIICLTVAVLVIGVQYKSLAFATFRNTSDLVSPAGSPVQWENSTSAPSHNESGNNESDAASLARHLVFVLVLLGLGIRAGSTPFHFWVPIVHPQSPTTTHAFSLGVSIKVAVYLMIRFFLEFLHPVSWWWGSLVLVLAGVTALVNVFYALISPDLKRALAYHSVENIGIIMAGVGTALLFKGEIFANQEGAQAVANLALMASLYHVLNHALFKGLLYLGTGSIENRTGTVMMDRLGGLLRRFPWTGTTFLVGAIAIAGFPPFNGFISEWLTVQALLAGATVGSRTSSPLVTLVLLVALILLGLSFALTAMAFVKIAGETLLGLPRDRNVAHRARRGEVPWTMRGAMVVLAGLCLVLGVIPSLLMPWLTAAVKGGASSSAIVSMTWTATEISIPATNDDSYSAVLSTFPLLVLLVLPLLATAAAAVWRRWVPARRSPVWAGGEPYKPESMQYTGSAFSALIWEGLSSSKVDEKRGPLPTSFRLTEKRGVPEMFHRWFNRIVWMLSRWSEELGNALQSGDIRAYLLYIFGAFIGVLALLVVLLREVSP